jgi:hypothetical protein
MSRFVIVRKYINEHAPALSSVFIGAEGFRHGAPMVLKPLGDFVHVGARLQTETLAKIQNPCEEPIVWVKKQ